MKSNDAINERERERERERVEAPSNNSASQTRRKAKVTFLRAFFVSVFLLGSFLTFSAYANAATPVYYSVGQLKYSDTGGNHMTGTPHVTIASGVATFDTAQTGNIGVGDRVTYNTSSIAYISGRTSQTVWNVITATGTMPANISNSSVVSIGHEYKHLNDAFWGAYDSSHINGLDLTASSTILNIPCYYDNGPDTTNVSWPTGGYVTSAADYIRIYTPTSTAEVNQSQRHIGKWTSTAYELDLSGTAGIPGGVNFLRIDGLQIKLTTTVSSRNGITTAGKLITDATDIQISNNIIQGVISGATTGNAGIYGGYWASPSNNTARVWNNIVYGFANGGVANEIGIEGYGVDMYVYNNTVYGSDTGMDLEGTSKFIAKNNIVQNSINYGYRHNTNFTSSSTNNVSDRADAPGSNPKNSTTTVFVNTSTSDFHLAPNDTTSIDKGVNLSADTALPFNTDIDGQARPYNSTWDIGADEYQPAAATTYTFTGPTGGTVNTASTNFTVTPNGIYNATITITPTGGFGLSPTVITFSNSMVPQTFTITPTAGGTITLTTSNNGGLTDASNLTYVVATVPTAPTGVSAATSSPNQATVSFTPGSDGGSAILYYLASSTPGNFTATSTGSPIVVTGLTNNTSYTFAVYAVNAVGTSSPSSASNAVAPTPASATTYTFAGPASGNVGSASTNFTVTPNGAYSGTITITPTAGFGLSPTVLTFNSATPQTFTITPTVAGSITLTPTNNGSLSPNPANLTYTANGPMNVYYSVGQVKYNDTGGNLMTGNPTVNIVSGVATFSAAQTGNVGIGDRVTYNGSTIAYISGRTSQTVWNVITATGTTPVNVTGATVNSIGHEYNSLNAGVWGAYDSSHTNGLDLTASNLILNIPCYYDNGPDTTSMNWPTGGYVTSATNYVRIYTPTSTSEVNHSQRHTGKWTTTAYRREVNADVGIRLGPNFVRIDGLQIQNTASTTTRNGISGAGKLITDATDIQISNNIVRGILSGGATDNYGIYLGYWPTQSNNTAHVWNNVVYGFANGTTGRGIAGYNVDLYAYNNTMFNDYTGIRRDGVNLLVAKNNIVQNSTIGYSGTFSASSTNNISNNSSVASSTADHALVAVAFADSANNDFHIVSGDTAAKDAGTNLSADTAFPFNTDIDGQARPYGSFWDIGADEMYPSSDVTAPIIDTFTMPTTATNFTVSVTAFTGHDDVAVAGYLITESASTPSLTNANWSSTTPATFTFTGAGVRTAYAWVKDTSGNISSSASQPVNITLATNTYYIDATGGNNSNTGTSTDHAWQTIAKVNSSTFQPGDHILFKRGETWREQLNVPSSGIADYPITFDAYGSGTTTPIISGANTVTGWTNYSGNIYVANVGSITTPTQLYVGGTFYDIAHYPDSGYLLATANSADATSIVDSSLALTSGQIVGATVVSKAVPWFISTASSTAYDSGTHTITLAAPVDSQSQSQIMRTGYGFYLQNMLWMLDQPGEWFYDSSAGKLYLWTTNGDDPTNHTVEVANRPYGIYNNGNNYVTIQNLAVANANQYYDVYVNNANNVTLNNLSVLGGQVGIYASGLATSSIQNNSIKNALVEGIYIPYGSNISIAANTVSNTGTAGITPKESEAGIYVGGTSLNVDSNTVTNSGYGGILFSGNLNIIQNNHIDNSCLVLDDCGGIYTFSNNELAGWTDIIRDNTVTNTMGSANGKPQTYTAGEGIYLDEKTHGFSVLNNIIYNADSGIHINNGYSNTISNNFVYGARVAGLSIVEANYGYSGDIAGVVHDNLITGNTFETFAGPSAYAGIYDGAVSYYSTFGSTATFGTYDHNQYCHPNESWAIANRIVNIGQVDNYTLPDWQTYSSQDLNSTETSSSCSQPSITTSAASPVSTSTVTLNGNISSNGYASSTIRGFAYGTAADLSTVIATTTESGTFGTGTFTANISSLTASTTYYFRAYSVNTAGTSTGAILSTTTLQLAISVPDAPAGVSAATSSPNQATVSFTPGSNGGSAILYYLASSTPGNFTATSTGSPIVVTGLTNNTSYTFAVYAVNAVGTSSPSSASNSVTPKAAVVAPTLTTSAASSVSTSTATLNAQITATGGADATQSGFAYGTVANLSTVIATSTLNGQTGNASFSQSLTNLTPNTTYYFRAYAVNSAGTSTGSILPFATTDTTPPTVAMTAPTSGATVNGNSVTLTATASDDVGVAGVQFKLDGTTNIGSEITSTSSPNTYTTTWDSTGITIYGSHTLYAVARDAAGNHSTSTISVNVDNVAPTMQSVFHDSDTQITVTLSKLASSTTITKANNGGFTVTQATTSGATYTVSSIAPGSDNTKVVLTVANMTTAGAIGVTVTYSHSGNGTITDTLGNVLATNGTGIAIPPWNTTAPIISNITSTVTDGPYKAGAAIDIDLTFSKAVNTSGTITVTLNTGGTCTFSGVSNSTTASCTYTVGGSDNTSRLNVSSVSGTITSTDSNPMTSFAPAVNLSVNKNIVIDTIAPSVSLDVPANGSTVSGTAVTLTANASDSSSGLAGVQFKLDGVNIGTEGGTSPYSITWNSKTTTSASHTLQAVSRDVAGNYATSSITVTVENTAPGVPTSVTATAGDAQAAVSFLAPADNGGATITGYTAISNPSGGIDGNAGTTALTHTVTGLVNGTPYTFTVTATNSNGTSNPSDPSTPVTPVGSVLPTYTIGGTVSGLNGTVVLQNNSGDNKSISSNGSFTFATWLHNGDGYSATVLTQPSSQTCSVGSGSGAVSAANVTSVSVTCADNSPTPTPTPVTTSYSSGGGGGSFYVAPKTVATTTATTTCQTLMFPIITKQLSLGMTGNDVVLLQKILTLERFFTTNSTSGTYGPQTTVAVSSFQKKNNIVISGTPETTGFGNVGPKTQAFINKLISQEKYPTLGQCVTSAPVSNTTTTNVSSYKFTRNLALGSIGTDVKALQVFMNAHGFKVASSGPGSAGNESTYFGPATKSALIKFQEYYAKDILIPNGLTKGTGFFGVSTMKMVNVMVK